jgi:hypothetical protein
MKMETNSEMIRILKTTYEEMKKKMLSTAAEINDDELGPLSHKLLADGTFTDVKDGPRYTCKVVNTTDECPCSVNAAAFDIVQSFEGTEIPNAFLIDRIKLMCIHFLLQLFTQPI